MPCLSRDWIGYACPKTGSTWLRRAMAEELGARNVGGGHDRRARHLAREREGRHAVGTVRNPWDWYVSWWLHAMNNDDAQRASLRTIGGGETDFRSVLYGCTHGRFARRVGVIADLVDQQNARKLYGLHAWGLCSVALHVTYGGRQPIHLLDTARLPEAAQGLWGGELSRWNRPPANTRAMRGAGRFEGPADYAAVYDDDMRSWVATADRALIGELGYEVHGPAAHACTTVRWGQPL